MMYNLATEPGKRNPFREETIFESQWIPHLGFRYQNPAGGFWMRAGVGVDTRMAALDFPYRPYLGLGVGLSDEPLERNEKGKIKRRILVGPTLGLPANPIVPLQDESYSSTNTSSWYITDSRQVMYSISVGGFVRVQLTPDFYLHTQLDYHSIGAAIEANHGSHAGWFSDFLPSYNHDYVYRYRLGMLSLSPLLRYEKGNKVKFFMRILCLLLMSKM